MCAHLSATRTTSNAQAHTTSNAQAHTTSNAQAHTTSNAQAHTTSNAQAHTQAMLALTNLDCHVESALIDSLSSLGCVVHVHAEVSRAKQARYESAKWRESDPTMQRTGQQKE